MNKITLSLIGIFISFPAIAEFDEPPPPPPKVYTTVPPYNYYNSAKRQYYSGRKPGEKYCSSGCDAGSEAYRNQYQKYQDYKAKKDFEKYYH